MSATSVSMSATNVSESCEGGHRPGRRGTSTAALLVGVTVTIVLGGCTTSAPGSGPASAPGSQVSPSGTGRARQSSGGDSLPARTATHSPTEGVCNQGVVCSSSVFVSTSPPTPSRLMVRSAECSPVNSEGRTRCDVAVISAAGLPFTLGDVYTVNPSPGSQWLVEPACTEAQPEPTCLIHIDASGPVGQTLTARLVVQESGGSAVAGTPLQLVAVPAAASGSAQPSSTP
jgi:hypothetical protein